MKASVCDVASICISAAAYSADKVYKTQTESKNHFTTDGHSVCLLGSALRSMWLLFVSYIKYYCMSVLEHSLWKQSWPVRCRLFLLHVFVYILVSSWSLHSFLAFITVYNIQCVYGLCQPKPCKAEHALQFFAFAVTVTYQLNIRNIHRCQFKTSYLSYAGHRLCQMLWKYLLVFFTSACCPHNSVIKFCRYEIVRGRAGRPDYEHSTTVATIRR